MTSSTFNEHDDWIGIGLVLAVALRMGKGWGAESQYLLHLYMRGGVLSELYLVMSTARLRAVEPLS